MCPRHAQHRQRQKRSTIRRYRVSPHVPVASQRGAWGGWACRGGQPGHLTGHVARSAPPVSPALATSAATGVPLRGYRGVDLLCELPDGVRSIVRGDEGRNTMGPPILLLLPAADQTDSCCCAAADQGGAFCHCSRSSALWREVASWTSVTCLGRIVAAGARRR